MPAPARGGRRRAEAADVDTACCSAPGFPFFLGGITKHLDQTGVSERVAGPPLAELAGVYTPEQRDEVRDRLLERARADDRVTGAGR